MFPSPRRVWECPGPDPKVLDTSRCRSRAAGNSKGERYGSPDPVDPAAGELSLIAFSGVYSLRTPGRRSNPRGTSHFDGLGGLVPLIISL
jgi:hypothetical protein